MTTMVPAHTMTRQLMTRVFKRIIMDAALNSLIIRLLRAHRDKYTSNEL